MTTLSASITHTFLIAEHLMGITFCNPIVNNLGLLNSFYPFLTETTDNSQQLLLHLTVDDSLLPVKGNKERIGKFDTGNGETVVDLLPNGGYQFIVKDIANQECCLLQSDKQFAHCSCALKGNYDMRRFGLNNAVMLAYSFATSRQDTLLIHASLVRNNGYGYAFIAKSGTGKSTQVSSWLRYISGCDLMNDDNPIIRIIDNKAYIFGSPWSGKTPCYRQVKARLGAVTRIDRALQNSIEQLPPIEAFASLLPSCSSMKWDSDIFNAICNTVTKVVESTPIYTLHCLPDKESAILCHKTISR